MKLTTNYSLKKPEGSDVVNIDDFNYNADIIDNAIQEIKNTSSTNKTNISSLQSKVNNGQNYKITNEDGSSLVLDEHTDLDTVVKTGFYIGHNLKNSPNYTYANWYHLDVRGNSVSCLQTLTQAVYEGRGQQFIRALYNGSWSEWREL